MLRLLSDENFRGEILRGLRRRLPDVDVVRVQDVGLSGADDPAILAWAATAGRILLTHDRNTIPEFAYDRVRHRLSLPGVFVVDDNFLRDKQSLISCWRSNAANHPSGHELIYYFPL